MKNILLINIFLVFFINTVSSLLPPVREEWSIQIEDAITEPKLNSSWLKNHTFYAPLRIKPNESWNAFVEALWLGPNIQDSSQLVYIELLFTPLDTEIDNLWSGDKKLLVKSYDFKTNLIRFAPENNKTFMIAPKERLGIYNNMYFTLAIGNVKIPTMFVNVNTRIERDVEVTCSDGLFCNGEERFVKGKCINSDYKPCANSDPCKSYECVESKKQCDPEPKGGSSCKACKSNSFSDVSKQCADINYECGLSYETGIFCGECSSQDYICSRGKCLLKSSLGEGSCSKPYQLLNNSLVIPKEGINNLTIYGDLSLPIYTDNVLPICHPAAVPDVVYVFQIKTDYLMGMEIQMLSAYGTLDKMDTVLALTDENCQPLALYSFCGDDSSPPGGLSSRVFGKLSQGTYKLVATGFSHVLNDPLFGPYQLKIKFYPNCVPQCEGNRNCGPDGCGGTCGTCKDGKECHIESGQCRKNPCVQECILTKKNNSIVNKQCGDDTCGGLCGSCNPKNSEMCVAQSGLCKKVNLCNHLRPMCQGNSPASFSKPYCAHDCQWHDMSEDLGDLMPNNKDTVLPSVLFEWRFVSNRSCATVEGCFKHQGDRYLMRFDTNVHNVGKKSFHPPPPEESPNLFQWSPCHAHYHYDGFASFNLLDLSSKLIATGGKRGYCLEDTIQVMFGEEIPCSKAFSCENQGIQPGWADRYRNDLDCQWIDITDIKKEKWYVYEICTNIERKLIEASYTNNCKRFPIYVPYVEKDLTAGPVKYEKILQARNITSEPTIKQEPGQELEVKNSNTTNTNSAFQNIINFFSNIFSFLFRN